MQKNLILLLGYTLSICTIHIIKTFQICATLLKFAVEVVIFLRSLENLFTCCKFIAGSADFSGAFSTE